MRIVLDTNVLISAFIARGVCRELFEYTSENHELFTSGVILDELQEKLARKFKLTAPLVEAAVEAFASRMQRVKPAPLDPPACRDPDDDWVLATALAAKCDCIVTGDADLLDMRAHAGIRIVRPGAFSEFEAEFTAG